MKKALVIGIDDYPQGPLECCVNDAMAFAEAIKRNHDGSRNFGVKTQVNIKSRRALLELIKELFKDDADASLFYFSGHGYSSDQDTYLVTPDSNEAISMTELLRLLNESPARNRIVILDCCHAGDLGVQRSIGEVNSRLAKGTTILTASKGNQVAVERNGHGVFTNLLLSALEGGAADIRGFITAGSIYAYVDSALEEWDQRPVFKTNVSEFNILKKTAPKIDRHILLKISQYFPTPTHQFPLNPSFEFKNSPEEKTEIIEPYADPYNVLKFKDLQKLQSVGLVVPVDAEHMYFAAMQSKSCKLTALGYHYWHLAEENKV